MYSEKDDDPYKTDLSQFGHVELKKLSQILDHWANKRGLPKGFVESNVQAGFNSGSGCVFLTNGEYQSVMYNPRKKRLAMWWNSPYAGQEGFAEDLLEEYMDMHEEDQEWFRDEVAPNEGLSHKLPSLEVRGEA